MTVLFVYIVMTALLEYLDLFTYNQVMITPATVSASVATTCPGEQNLNIMDGAVMLSSNACFPVSN